MSLGGFDPPPRRWSYQCAPITLQWLVWYVPPFIFRLFHRTYPSHPFFWCVHLPNISLGCFDQPSWARHGLKCSKHVSSAPQWFWYAPLCFSIAYRLVANSLFFCALEAVVRTLVQMDSISYALTIELNAPLTHHTHYTPKIFLFITHSLYFGWLGEHVSTW